MLANTSAFLWKEQEKDIIKHLLDRDSTIDHFIDEILLPRINAENKEYKTDFLESCRYTCHLIRELFSCSLIRDLFITKYGDNGVNRIYDVYRTYSEPYRKSHCLIEDKEFYYLYSCFNTGSYEYYRNNILGYFYHIPHDLWKQKEIEEFFITLLDKDPELQFNDDNIYLLTNLVQRYNSSRFIPNNLILELLSKKSPLVFLFSMEQILVSCCYSQFYTYVQDLELDYCKEIEILLMIGINEFFNEFPQPIRNFVIESLVELFAVKKGDVKIKNIPSQCMYKISREFINKVPIKHKHKILIKRPSFIEYIELDQNNLESIENYTECMRVAFMSFKDETIDSINSISRIEDENIREEQFNYIVDDILRFVISVKMIDLKIEVLRTFSELNVPGLSMINSFYSSYTEVDHRENEPVS